MDEPAASLVLGGAVGRDALFPGLPRATLARAHPHLVVPLAQLAGEVTASVRHLSEAVRMRDNAGDEMSVEMDYAAPVQDAIERGGASDG